MKKGAEDGLGRIIDFSRTPETYLRLSNEKYIKGDIFGALVLLRRAEELYPYDGEIKFRIAEALIAMERYELAMDSLAWLLERNGEFCVDAVSGLGFCYMGMHEYRAAKDAFSYFITNTSLEDCSDDEFSEMLAMIDACDTYTDMPVEDECPPVRDALEIRTERMLEHAARLVHEEKYGEALALLEPEIKNGRFDSRLIHLLLVSCYCSNEIRKGIQIIEEIPSAERAKLEADVDQLCLMELIYYKANESQKAKDILDKILRTEINSIDSFMRVSMVMFECNENEYALKIAENGYKAYPYEPNIIHTYARAAYANGDSGLARRLYDRILTIHPNNPAAKYYRGICDNAQAGERVRQFTVTLELPPAELIRRVDYVKSMSENGEKDVRTLWEDERFRETAEWALSSVREPFFGIFLMFLPAVDRERVCALLKRALIDCEIEKQLKEMAAKMLDDLGEKGPYFVYSNGRLLGCTTYSWSDYMTNHISYKRIWDKFEENCSFKDDEELMASAEKFMKALAIFNSTYQPSVPAGQQAALAAAIEYSVLSFAERSIDLESLTGKYGITVRRLDNALNKLDDCMTMYNGIDDED